MERKTIRIKADLSGNEKVIKVNLKQNFDTLDVLSLKIDQKNTYLTNSSDYGILIGRVIANDGFGVPNAKVSIFIPTEEIDENTKKIYPYSNVSSVNENNIRYNLLQSNKKDDCKQNVGTFPDKRTLLDNNLTIDIFDKYYKYTTSTNQAGDYMIYGIPVGTQKVHVDIDLSDIGVLSQSPRDMIYQGFSPEQFESYNKFKSSTNLDSLPQIISQDSSVYIYPFTGDEENTETGISRHDIKIQYKFEPTCVFMGSVFGDSTENSISKDCIVDENAGSMDKLITGTGRIEMIRKTIDGKIEFYNVQNTNLIDTNGTWLYQIPMNLDYMVTDEYGNMIPSDDITKGIPTRSDVRFRIQLDDFDLTENKKRASYLIPNNPETEEESDYEFGLNTSDKSFVTLLWNKVYTVKNYIPRFQQNGIQDSYNFLGIKGINYYGKNSPIPFNNIRIQSNLSFMFSCIMYKLMFDVAKITNNVLTSIASTLDSILGGDKFSKDMRCSYITSVCGYEESEKYALIVGCDPASKPYQNTLSDLKRDSYIEYIDEISSYVLSKYPRKGTREYIYFANGTFTSDEVYSNYIKRYCVEIAEENIRSCYEKQLTKENGVLNYDFYNDWLNGSLYLPIFSYNKTSEKDYSYCGNNNNTEKNINFSITQPCSLAYTSDNKGFYKNIYKKYPYNCYIETTLKDKSSIKSIRRENNDGYKMLGSGRNTNYSYRKNQLADLNLRTDQNENIEGRSNRSGTIYSSSNIGYIPNKNCYGQLNMYTIPSNQSFLINNNNGVFYYRSSFMTDKNIFNVNKNKSVIGLATDIVLLGSLNECDLDGVPKIPQSYPATSYNMPPQRPISRTSKLNGIEYISDCDSLFFEGFSDFDNINYTERIGTTLHVGHLTALVDNCYGNEKYSLKSNSNIEITGQDWVDDKIDRQGLFVRIGCIDNTTKFKTCVNVNRICELGVGLDSYTTITSVNDNGDEFKINSVPNGFITPAEIKNNEIRSMFSTLNYNNLKTVLNYDGRVIYDLKYNYTTMFDGRLNEEISSENNIDVLSFYDYYFKLWNYDGTKKDVLDENYYLYRFGGDKDSFYIHSIGEENNNSVDIRVIPKYLNSFYFYFGLNNGNSVINKFNSTYLAKCQKSSGGNSLGLSIDSITNPIFCGSNGSISFSIKEGNTPYSIKLIKNSNETEYIVDSRTYDKTYTINNLEKGEYILTVTDINNNISETNITLQPKNKINLTTRNVQTSTQNGGLYNIVVSDLTNAYKIVNGNIITNNYVLKLFPLINDKEGSFFVEKISDVQNDVIFDKYITNENQETNITSGSYKLYVYDEECSLNMVTKIITLEDVAKLTLFINDQNSNNLINSGYVIGTGLTVTNDISLYPDSFKIYKKEESRLSLNAIGGVPPYTFSIKGIDLKYNDDTLSYESGSTYNTKSQELTGERIGSNSDGVDLPLAEGVSYNFVTKEKDNQNFVYEVKVTDSNTNTGDTNTVSTKIRLVDMTFGVMDSVWSIPDKSLSVRFKNGIGPYTIDVINPSDNTNLITYIYNKGQVLTNSFSYSGITYSISANTFSVEETDVPFLYSVKIKSDNQEPLIKQIRVTNSNGEISLSKISPKEVNEYPITYN